MGEIDSMSANADKKYRLYSCWLPFCAMKITAIALPVFDVSLKGMKNEKN
jgi:hypothetical protein